MQHDLLGDSLKRGNSGFAKELQSYIDHRGFSIADLAKETGTTYEHIRKLVKGQAYPSKQLFLSICHALRLDSNQKGTLLTILATERTKRKYGSDPFKTQETPDPDIRPIARLWPYLKNEQKQIIAELASVMAKRNSAKEGKIVL